jgi:hypothetical protein
MPKSRPRMCAQAPPRVRANLQPQLGFPHTLVLLPANGAWHSVALSRETMQ